MATTAAHAPGGELLEPLGVDPGRFSEGELVVRTPITGEEIARVARTDAAAADAGPRARRRRLSVMAREYRHQPRRARAAARRRAAPREGGARRLVTLEVGKIRGGPRRGPGDGRHLRLRGRSLAAALRPLDRLGATGHRLTETWHPLGPVGVNQAFNSRSRCGAGMPRSRWCAAVPSCAKPSKRHALQRRPRPCRCWPGGQSGTATCPTDCSSSSSAAPTALSSCAEEPHIALVSSNRSTTMGKSDHPGHRGPPRPLAARGQRSSVTDRRSERRSRPRRARVPSSSPSARPAGGARGLAA